MVNNVSQPSVDISLSAESMPSLGGSGPMPPEQPQMTQEEMKVDLENTFNKIEDKEREVNSQEFLGKNSLEELKKELFQHLFEMMKGLGVDPNDLESINKFLTELRVKEPDLAEMFEMAFNDVVGEEELATPEPPQMVEEGSGMMEGFNNLAQDVMMPRA